MQPRVFSPGGAACVFGRSVFDAVRATSISGRTRLSQHTGAESVQIGLRVFDNADDGGAACVELCMWRPQSGMEGRPGMVGPLPLGRAANAPACGSVLCPAKALSDGGSYDEASGGALAGVPPRR